MSEDTWSDGGDPTEPDPAFDDTPEAMDEPVFDDDTPEDDPDGDGIDDEEEPSLTDGADDTPLDPDEELAFDTDDDFAIDDDPDTTPHDTVEVIDEEVPGTDPDATALADDDAFNAEFPPDIDLETMPEPIDGAPWSDADLLGDVPDTTDAGWNTVNDTSALEDLFTMDGGTGGDWESLLASDDPAVSSLARWWQP